MHIDVWSVGLQTVNFLVLVWLLNRFLFRPVMSLVERRRKAVESTLADADARRKDAEEMRRSYNEKLAAVSEERERLLTELRAAAGRERAAVLDRAALEANAVLEAGVGRLGKEREAILADIADRTTGLAVDLAEKLLAETADASVDELLLGRLGQDLAGRPAEQKESLIAAFGDGASVSIVTANPLSPDIEQLWRRRLAEIAPPLAKARFKADPSLVGGAEIRYPLGLICFTWRRTLDDARRLMNADHVAA